MVLIRLIHGIHLIHVRRNFVSLGVTLCFAVFVSFSLIFVCLTSDVGFICNRSFGEMSVGLKKNADDYDLATPPLNED